MRKWSVLAALCFVGLLAASADAASVPKHRSYTCLIGSAFGCLDVTPIVDADPTLSLVTGDFADVQVGGLRYFYQFDAAATNAEASPTYIRPDDYATAGVWVLSGVYAASVKVGGVDVQVQDAELTALAGLTFADASVIQLTGASAAAVLTSGGANRILGSTSDNGALEFKSSLPVSALTLGGIVLGDASPDSDGEVAFASNAYTFYANSEDMVITFGANSLTWSSNTGVTDISFSAMNLATTGTIDGAIIITESTNPTITVSGSSGFYTNADDDTIAFNLPALPTGKAFCFANVLYARAITVNPDDADYIVMAGVAGSAGESVVSTGAADEMLCVVGINASYWRVTASEGTWAQETP